MFFIEIKIASKMAKFHLLSTANLKFLSLFSNFNLMFMLNNKWPTFQEAIPFLSLKLRLQFFSCHFHHFTNLDIFLSFRFSLNFLASHARQCFHVVINSTSSIPSERLFFHVGRKPLRAEIKWKFGMKFKKKTHFVINSSEIKSKTCEKANKKFMLTIQKSVACIRYMQNIFPLSRQNKKSAKFDVNLICYKHQCNDQRNSFQL